LVEIGIVVLEKTDDGHTIYIEIFTCKCKSLKEINISTDKRKQIDNIICIKHTLK